MLWNLEYIEINQFYTVNYENIGCEKSKFYGTM